MRSSAWLRWIQLLVASVGLLALLFALVAVRDLAGLFGAE